MRQIRLATVSALIAAYLTSYALTNWFLRELDDAINCGQPQ